MSPRQTSEEYRLQQQRSLIGFGVYYKLNGNLKCINVDLVGGPSNQNGYDSVEAFRYQKIIRN